MSDTISIKLDDDIIKSDDFMKACRGFFKVAKNVATEMSAETPDVTWAVTVKEGSNIVIGKPIGQSARFAEAIVDTIMDGVRRVSRGEAIRPKHFNDDALEGLSALANSGVLNIHIAAGTIEFRMDRPLVIATIDAIVGPQTHKSFGEVEGKLYQLSDRGHFKFWIQDQTTDAEVHCHFTDAQLIVRAEGAFRKRVCVEGLITYRRDGTPNSIDASDLRIFDSEVLPKTADIIGIYKKA